MVVSYLAVYGRALHHEPLFRTKLMLNWGGVRNGGETRLGYGHWSSSHAWWLTTAQIVMCMIRL
ncbi:hypothetical protein JB92DRAFT_2914976 [Gautieria morchelliformis]|nr:hypothetical protein JB92DRAFT_2914976 [Gautieria morchelliformis]